jgi:hypothetical protein|eukprot:SAG25_NODE_888_length_4924_cov_17.004560_2_plen_72_part_00
MMTCPAEAGDFFSRHGSELQLRPAVGWGHHGAQVDAEMQALAARVGSVEAEAATVGCEALERCGASATATA